VIPIAEREPQWVFQPHDFDPAFGRGKSATGNLRQLFSDVVGCGLVVEKLEKYQYVSQLLKQRNKDPKPFIPLNFFFKGPPGTGKTTTARKMA
jgi:AAA+ superfamily predicted ATPase